MITIIFQILQQLLTLYRWAVILAAVMSMLMSFGVLDSRNRLVWTISDFLFRITEPALRPIRNMLPRLGNIDISPIILLVIIWALQEVLARIYAAIAFGNVGGLVL